VGYSKGGIELEIFVAGLLTWITVFGVWLIVAIAGVYLLVLLAAIAITIWNIKEYYREYHCFGR